MSAPANLPDWKRGDALLASKFEAMVRAIRAESVTVEEGGPLGIESDPSGKVITFDPGLIVGLVRCTSATADGSGLKPAKLVKWSDSGGARDVLDAYIWEP